MQCAKCQKESVVFQPYSGMYLCRNHFIADIEAKAKRDIRTHRWLQSGDHIGILVRGEKRDLALVHFLACLVANRRDVRVTIIFPGETGSGSGDTGCLRVIAELAGKAGIACVTVPGCSSDPGLSSILPGFAQEQEITKFAVSRSLDDAALPTLVSILAGKPEDLFGSAGTLCGNVPVMTPFLSVPAFEIDLYAELATRTCECKNIEEKCDAFTEEVKGLLDTYTSRHPATRYSLMHLAESIRHAGKLPGGSGKQKEVKNCAE